MPLTASSTSFIILQNNVSYLMNSFNWVVGAIGIVTTLVIILVGWYQTSATKNLTKQEVEKLKDDLSKIQKETLEGIKGEIKTETDKVYEQMKNELSVVFDEIKIMVDGNKSQMEKIKNDVMGEIARNYAIKNDQEGSFSAAFNWYLFAASSYSSADPSNEFVDKCLVWALSVLRKINKAEMKTEIDFLFERSEQNASFLKNIESVKPEKVQQIRDELKKKLTD
ncbi:MAG: hypothetical protein WCT07_01550 [Candidatus Paceibacterota bacterium]|jgi:gas vesicle protein